MPPPFPALTRFLSRCGGPGVAALRAQCGSRRRLATGWDRALAHVAGDPALGAPFPRIVHDASEWMVIHKASDARLQCGLSYAALPVVDLGRRGRWR